MADNPRIEDLRRRVQKDPASIAFAQLAEEYRRAGQLNEAVDVCRAGLAIHPGYLSARVTLGRALVELGHLADALTELQTVLKSAPENLAAIRGLADIHHKNGDLGEALKHYRSALTLARNDPDLEQTVAELTRKLAPTRGPQPVGGLTFEQMARELRTHAPPAPSNVARRGVEGPAPSDAVQKEVEGVPAPGGVVPTGVEGEPASSVLVAGIEPAPSDTVRRDVEEPALSDAVHRGVEGTPAPGGVVSIGVEGEPASSLLVAGIEPAPSDKSSGVEAPAPSDIKSSGVDEPGPSDVQVHVESVGEEMTDVPVFEPAAGLVEMFPSEVEVEDTRTRGVRSKAERTIVALEQWLTAVDAARAERRA